MISRLMVLSTIALGGCTVLVGCGLQGAIGPLLGGLSGSSGGSSTLTLQIDQAHGTLTMGNAPVMTTLPAPVTTTPVGTTPIVTVTPPPSIKAPAPVTTVP